MDLENRKFEFSANKQHKCFHFEKLFKNKKGQSEGHALGVKSQQRIQIQLKQFFSTGLHRNGMIKQLELLVGTGMSEVNLICDFFPLEWDSEG